MVDELRQFVELYDNEAVPAYYFEDGRHAGRRVVPVLKYKSVPTTRLYLTQSVVSMMDLGSPSFW